MAFLFSGAYLSKKYNNKLLLAFVSGHIRPNLFFSYAIFCCQIYTLPNIAGTIVFLSAFVTTAAPSVSHIFAQLFRQIHTPKLDC